MQRETIIQLAAEMFVGQGIKAVRMDDIARHIGVSKRTIYEQFGDKEELLYQCLSYYVREQDRRHAELGAQAKNVLEAMLLVFGDVMDKAEISHRLQSNLRASIPKSTSGSSPNAATGTGWSSSRSHCRAAWKKAISRESSTSIWPLRCCVIRSRG